MQKKKEEKEGYINQYREVFWNEILKKNAEFLESQEEPDIDNLMAIVEESMTAYKACKLRIDAVQQALNDTFKE